MLGLLGGGDPPALGAGVDVITHVRTQLPYALTAGVISLALGYVPAGLGLSPWLLIPAGSALCVLSVLALGTKPTSNAELLA